MKQTISFPGGTFTFDPIHLRRGQSTLNPVVSRKNLVDVRWVLHDSDIKWGLIFGTLLGAVRESGLIAHDEDTDLFVFYEDKSKLLAHLPRFVELGFQVARYEEYLFTILRDGDYIDFYFLRKSGCSRKMPGHAFPSRFFREISQIKIFGTLFPIPADAPKLLERIYGEDWQTPKKGFHAQPKKSFLRNLLDKSFPGLSRRLKSLHRRTSKM